MINFENGGRLVRSVSELPDLRKSRRLYADFETTSGDRHTKSTNPWRDCFIAGFGITIDDAPGAWYVPVGHHEPYYNLPFEPVMDWLNDCVQTTDEWINHNVKYDAHVATNCGGIVNLPRLICTLNLAKIIDSDRMHRGGYGLDALSKAWLHENIDKYHDAMFPYLEGDNKNKDYGAVPADIMGEYCCQDVITNRRLYHYIDSKCPEQCRRVWRNEIELTTLLYEMERTGMPVDMNELKLKELSIYARLAILEEKLEKIVGRSFRPHVNEDCFDVLCNQYGLPILAWTEEPEEEGGEPEGNPSFDKNALKGYLARPDAPENLVQHIIDYRKLHTMNAFFVKRYQEKATQEADGSYSLHSTYNQTVRTGRMSSKDPNSQQLNKEAKGLIHPRKGCRIVSSDASQIEFRIIGHYIRDQKVIDAYAHDPYTDYHSWVAELCGIDRDPAKTVNFEIAFGAGRKKVLKGLSAEEKLVKEFVAATAHLPPERRVAAFEALCLKRATQVFDGYHRKLPGIRRTSKQAEYTMLEKGYVYNLLGRHRQLPPGKAHLAFNTVNQGSAADIIKEQMLRLRRVLRAEFPDVQWLAQVHDELVWHAPDEVCEDPSFRATILEVLENPDLSLRIPLRFSYGTSHESWRDAVKDADKNIKDPVARLHDPKLAKTRGIKESLEIVGV